MWFITGSFYAVSTLAWSHDQDSSRLEFTSMCFCHGSDFDCSIGQLMDYLDDLSHVCLIDVWHRLTVVAVTVWDESATGRTEWGWKEWMEMNKNWVPSAEKHDSEEATVTIINKATNINDWQRASYTNNTHKSSISATFYSQIDWKHSEVTVICTKYYLNQRMGL